MGVDRLVEGRRRLAGYPQEGSRLLSTTVADQIVDISRIPDEELLRLAELLATESRGKTCELVESLAEIDRRKLFREFDYTSLFDYCVGKLKMSEAAAYRRIRAARALQLFPHISALLRAGTLTLESIALLHPYLNDADAGALLTAAVGKRVSEVEKLVASRRTQEPRHDVVRMIAPQLAPQTRTQEEPPLFSAPPKIAPVAPAMAPPRFAPETAPHDGATLPSPPPALARSTAPPQSPSPRVEQSETHAVRIAFTADAEFHRLLQETQAAMRHKYPDGRLDGVFRDALRALLRKIRPWAYRKGVPVLEGRE